MNDEPIIRPQLSPDEALSTARDRFGVSVDGAHPLPSDRDQNFLLSEAASGRSYVLKLAHAREEREVLDFQNRILEHLALAGFESSKALHSTSGQEVVDTPGPEGEVFLTRLLTWIPGKVLADVNPRTPALYRSLGTFLGGMDRVLEDFSHPAENRVLKWDMKGAGRVVRSHLRYVDDVEKRDLLEEMTERFLERLGPLVPDLRMSVIHADANDHNVLVNEIAAGADPTDRRVIGVVDFGDAVRSFTAGEVAVGAAYAMLDRADPFRVAAEMVAGYHASFGLREPEVEALFPLMGLRLCASVAIAAHQKQREPGLEYLTVSEAPAWDLLERLEKESMELPHYLFRQACGLEPVPGASTVVDWLEEHGREAAPVVGGVALDAEPLHIFDFSITGGEFGVAPEPGNAEAWTDLCFRKMKSAGARVGVGRWNEVRRWYTSDIFRAETDDAPEWRTVHIGVDLFMDPGTPVSAPFHGVVHSVGHNQGALDYGPTVILEHRMGGGDPEGHGGAQWGEGDSSWGGTPRGRTFWTLYGHLSEDVLTSLTPGQEISWGEAFAAIGSYPVNGNWAPHLHFQVITDLMGRSGDFPGVCRPSQRDVWTSISPDPNLVLRMPDPASRSAPGNRDLLNPERSGPAKVGAPSGVPLTAGTGHAQEEILHLRREYLGPNLSIAYKRPLKIVRGQGQFLFDHQGQAYLDCVNNVPNVGHSHPRVVEAGRRQMAILNTNTRYLHDLLVEYAEDLVALLPGDLSRVYFVNSGSEANELALRMARAHTKRKDVVTVEGAYHGHTAAMIDVSPYKFDGPGGEGARNWVHKVPIPDPYRGRFRALPEDEFVEGLEFAAPPESRAPSGQGDEAEPRLLPADEVGRAYADQVKQVVALMRAGGRHPSAFFCESMLGCGGQIVLPEGYLTAAFDHVREAGGVCIADEVQVGFGRAGTHFWAFETQEVVPDIVTLGKPMGNGHPMGAVVTTPAIAESFQTGMEYFNTYGGNPVSCAIGLAVLDVIREERLQENAREVGDHLKRRLTELQKEHPLLGDVRGLGLYLGVEIVSDPDTREPAKDKANRIKERLRDHRILLSTDGPRDNVLKIKPPLVFTMENADRLVDSLAKVLKEEEFRA